MHRRAKIRFLLCCLNYAPEPVGIGKYTAEMAEWLTLQGIEVRVVTAPPYYPEWSIRDGYSWWRYRKEVLNGVKVIRCPLWIPVRPNGPKRLLHLLSFAFSSVPAMLSQITWRPHVVFAVEPPLFAAPVALLTARLASAKAWLHVQDYEVEAFFGLGFLSIRTVKKIIIGLESWLMRRFDRISSISKRMLFRLASLEISPERVSLFPNWVNTDHMHPNIVGKNFRHEWGLDPTSRIILYAGSMGQKQGLEMVLETALLFQTRYPDVLFLIVGEGAAKPLLMAMSEKLGLRNVVFKPPQLLQDLPALLSLAHVHLVIQRAGVADAVMPSKLTGIFAVGGTAIVTADADTELGQIINQNPGIAILVPPEDPLLFQQALVETLSDTMANNGMNEIARRYAETHLDTEVILTRFYEILYAEIGANKVP